MLRDLLARELLADGGGARARVRDHRFSRFHRCGLLEVGSVADGSQVAELVTAGGSVFALTSCGVCVGFDAASGRRLERTAAVEWYASPGARSVWIGREPRRPPIGICAAGGDETTATTGATTR